MPRYTFLETDLCCPHCNHLVTDLVWFGWGYSDAQQPTSTNTYRIGDTIRWRSCSDGTTPAWGWWDDKHNGFNMGDPSVFDLVTLDTANVTWGSSLRCPSCQADLPGIAIEIQDGIIQRCWIFSAGEYNPEIEYNLIEPDGNIRPMPDWSDNLCLNRLWHPVSDDC